MKSPLPADGEASTEASQFNTTQWSVVLLAGQSQVPDAEAALESLCRNYWKPLYAYVRRQGHSPQDAEDLTQEFFSRLLEKNYLTHACRERGRFRSFLLKSLKHFLINDWIRGKAQKRGGGKPPIAFDEGAAEKSYAQHPSNDLAAENLYNKRWALALLEAAMERIATDYATAGKRDLFHCLRPLLLSEGSAISYAERARLLGMSEGAVKVAVHRLRRRFAAGVRDEVARTVATPDEVDEEMRCLMAALSS